MTVSDDLIASKLLELLGQREPNASVCPSDVARSLASSEQQWRALMPEVRRVASALAAAGVVQATQGDAVVDLGSEPSGPIRLRRGPAFRR
jgi:hypothetical protein